MRSRVAVTIGLLLCAVAVGAILFVVQSGPSGSVVARAQGDEGTPANGAASAQNGQPGEGEEELPPPKVLPTIISEPRYTSTKPRYVWIVMTQDAQKVLPVVFDESKGTGTGYDVLYGDFNFDRRIEATAKRVAETERYEGYLFANWEPFPLNVRYNDQALEVEQPSSVGFGYFRYEDEELFHVVVQMSLAQDSSTWQYFAYGEVKPGESFSKAPVLRFNLPPQIKITANPDDNQQGNTGIALEVMLAGCNLHGATSDGQPLSATVVVRDANGKAVTQKTGDLMGFGFG